VQRRDGQRPPHRPPRRERPPIDPDLAMNRLATLVRYIAGQLVDDPDAIQVRARRRGRAVILRLSVPHDQLGKVIGREGKIARAIRTMLGIAAVRQGVHASLTIDDQIDAQPTATS
jgi:predicted RNA-binding protein YlqC (UPF0109 family)